jgi:DNA modification methylase
MSYRQVDGVRVNQRTGKQHTKRQTDGDMEKQTYRPPALSNPGNVVDIGAAGGGRLGSPLSHLNEAPFAEALAEFFVRSFCQLGGVVCDPFSGSGTIAAVALRWGRHFRGCDLRQSQVDLTRRRIEEELAKGINDAVLS